VVAGFVETLLDMELPPDEQRRCLEMVRRQTGTMQRLVEDLLTLASLENATQPPESTPVAVGPLLQQLVADTRALSGGQHRIEVVTESDAALLATPGELDSAVRNLLTNAVRYTPAGGRITVGWAVRGGEGWLSVRDTGIGISAEHLPRITERFYRVDRGRSRETGGTGLGLAIVKRLVEAWGGEVTVDSVPGQGTTVHLRLRVAAPPAAA
jgi:two-component system phosphate regulon sensor histidine kinase PhoR